MWQTVKWHFAPANFYLIIAPLVVGAIFLPGCVPETNANSHQVQGKISKILPVREDGGYTVIFIYFDDNRIVKLRSYYYTAFEIKIGSKHIIKYDNSLCITEVIVEKP